MPKKLILITLILVLAGAGLMAAGRKADRGQDPNFLTATVADGPHPDLLIWTDNVVYTGGPVLLWSTIDPNGNSAPRVIFLYLKNQNTGELRYIDGSGLLAPGVVRALNGSGPDNFTATDITAVEELVVLGPGGLAPALNAAQLPTAHYQLVMDLREGSGQRTVTSSWFNFGKVDNVVPVTSDITQNSTWTSNNAYLLDDFALFVRSGASLTIEPGTFVLGTGENSAFIVEKGGKLFARGTKARPIIMTAADSVGDRNRGDWGGLILNGNAPINVPGGQAEGEGDTGFYGGNDPTDSSGELSYVRVEFAGIEFSPDNELNGIAFQGTGSGTKVEYVQVHYNKDDGLEYFGGTTNTKYAVLTGIGDDSLDWTQGWSGKIQFVCAQQKGDDADRGIEADGNANNNNVEPFSNPQVYNVTLVGDPTARYGAESTNGLILREGTAGLLRNLVVTGFKRQAVNVDKIATVDRINAGLLTFRNSLFWQNCTNPPANGDCAGPNGADQFALDAVDNPPLGGFSTRTWITSEPTNRVANPHLRNPFGLVPDFRPALNSPALNKNFVAIPPDDGFFSTDVDYVGCMSPVLDWTTGWTTFVPF